MMFLKSAKQAVKSIIGKGKKQPSGHEGTEYYKPSKKIEKNPGFQSYYTENIDAIRSGNVPDRYARIANLTPGEDILEIGSADGTQSLTLARGKSRVCGLELMPTQFRESLNLQKRWIDIGYDVKNCEFRNISVMDSLEILDGFETVLMSRVLYHLRSDIEPLLAAIAKSRVQNAVLVGCPIREANWMEKGATGDAMGRFAYYASLEGMTESLRRCGFEIIHSEPSAVGVDPIVIGAKAGKA